MKVELAILLLLVASVVFISGCVKQQGGTGAGKESVGEEKNPEEIAESALEDELLRQLENETLGDVENTLLQQ